jgi:excisionase family DNA binding protein
MEPLLTMRAFCTILGIQTQTGYKWRREGKLKVLKTGRSIRVPKTELYRVMEDTPSFREQCAREAAVFLTEHPDYFPIAENEVLMLNYLDDHNLPVTAQTFSAAYQDLKEAGLLELGDPFWTAYLEALHSTLKPVPEEAPNARP